MSFQHWMRVLLAKKNSAPARRHPRVGLTRVEALEERLAPAINAYVDDNPGNVVSTLSPVFNNIGFPLKVVAQPDAYDPVIVYGGTYDGFDVRNASTVTVLRFDADPDTNLPAEPDVVVNPIGPFTDVSIGSTISWLTNTPTTINSTILPNVSVPLGERGLIKAGPSTLKFTAANTYDGPTSVNAGTLLVNNATGSGTGTSLVTVNNGGTLGGTGSVGNSTTVNSGGSISPGEAGPGLFKMAGLSFNAGSLFTIELNGTTPGTQYDQLEVSAAPVLSGATLTGTVGFAPGLGDTFTIINNTSAQPITTTFANDQGGFVTIGGRLFQILYNAGPGGNDVLLTAIPKNPIFVDDSFAGSTVGNLPLNAPPGFAPVVFGVNAFTTIQEAVNAVDVGGDIIVFGGTYPGAVNVNKVIGQIKSDTNTANATTTAEKTVFVNGAVTLDENTVFSQDAAENNLTFGSTINGAKALSVNGAGITTFADVVGAGTPLASLTTDANGTTVLGSNITTSGAQSYGDAVSLSAASALSTTNSAVSFTSTVNGGQSLSVTTGTADSLFTGAVGATTPLTSLTVSGANTTFGSTVATTGAFAVTMTGPTGASFGGNVSAGTTLDVTGNAALTANVTLTHGTTMSVSGTTLALGANTLTTDDGGAGAIASAITGTGALVKQGGGSLLLSSGSSSYSGTTTVLNGALLVGANAPSGANGALGNATSQVVVGDTAGGNSASLLADGAFTIGRTVLVRSGSSGTMRLGNNSATAADFSGDVTLQKDVTLTAPTGGSATFSGVLSGAGAAVTKTGDGTATLSGTASNSYTGLTMVTTGLLLFGKSDGVNAIGGHLAVSGGEARNAQHNQIPDASNVTVSGGALYNLAAFSERIATLTGTGDVAFGADGVNNVLALGDSTSFTFDGRFVGDDTPGPLDSIVKLGTGTLTLTGANPFTGAVAVNAGTILLNGSFSTTSTAAITVASGATLGGTGSANRPVTISAGGHLAPGTSPGIFTIDSLTMTATATFDIELNGTAAGTQYDQLVVDAGAVDLGGATLTGTRLAGFVPATGTPFTIINKTSAGAVTGTFAQGSSVVIGGITFSINYAGGDGNDVVLTVAAPSVVYVDDSFTQGTGDTIADADLGTAGNQPATFGYDAFTTIAAALAAVSSSGTVIVNGGSYAETVALSGTRTLEITGPDAAQSVTINGLDTIAGTPLVIEGSSLLSIGDSADHTLAGPITGSGALGKQGSGMLTITSSNPSRTGQTTLAAGTLDVQSDTALGTGTFTVTGGTLQSSNGPRVLDLNVAVGGGSLVVAGTNAITLGSATRTIDLGGGLRNVSVTATLTLDGVVSNGGLVMQGAGTLALTRANTFATASFVTAGTVQIGNDAALGTAALSMNGGSLEALGGTRTLTNPLGIDSGFTIVGSNSLVFASTVDLRGGIRTVTVTATQPATFGGVVSNGGLTKDGAGTLNLTAANTYSGATTVLDGRLNVNGSVSSDVTVTSPGVLGGTGTVTGNVSGTGIVAPGTSPGLLTIVGNLGPIGSLQFEVNGYATAGTDFDRINITGGVDLSGTALTFTGTAGAPALLQFLTLISNDLADATVTNGSTTPANGGTVSVNGNLFRLFHNGGDGNDVVLVAAAAPTTVYVDDNFSGNLGQTIADADQGTTGNQPAIFGVDAFTTVGEALSAVTASGTIVVNGGTYAETISLDGTKTLRVTGANSAQAVTISALSSIVGTTVSIIGSSSLTVGDAGNQTLAGLISGTGSLTKQGAGTLAISGANVGYVGTTTLAAGTLDILNNSALGAGTFVINAGTILSSSGVRQLANAVTVGGDFTAGGTNAVTLANGGASGINLGGTTRTVTVTNGAMDLFLDGAVSNGGLVKTGAGRLALNRANSFAGGATVSAGTLSFGDNAAAGTGTLAINGGAVQADGATRTLANAVTVGGNFSITGTQSLILSGGMDLGGAIRAVTVTATQPATFGGVVSNGGLTKDGAGTLNLTAANTYSSATTVLDGRLNVNGSVSSDVTVTSPGVLGGTGTVTGNVSGTGIVAPGTSPGLLTIVGNLGPIGSIQFEVNGYTPGATLDRINVTGSVNLDSANLSFVGTPPSPTPLQVVTLISNALADPTSAVGATPANGAAVSIGGENFTLFYNGGDGNDVVLIAAATPNTVYVDDDFSGLSGGTAIPDADLGTTGNQPGVFGVDAFATIGAAQAAVTSGGTIIVNGGTYTETVSLAGTRTLRITGPDAAQSVTVSALESIAGTTVSIQGLSSLTIGDGTDRTIAGALTGGGSLTKVGAGKLTLPSNNAARSGATTLSAGTLDVQDNNALGTGTFTIAGGTLQSSNAARTLDLNVVITGDFAIAGGNPITLASSGKSIGLGAGTRTVTVGTGQSLTLDGVVQNGGLTKQGTGTLSLTRANTFAGGLTLGAGGLQLGDDAAAGTGTFTINSGSVEAIGGTRTLANPVQVGGDFSIVGANSLILGGAMNLGGAARIVTVDTTQPATFGGVVSNGGLEKSGVGTLILAGANTYTSGTTVGTGTLQVNNTGGSGTGSGSVLVNNSATLSGDGAAGGLVGVNLTSHLAPGVGSVTGILTTGSIGFSPAASFDIDANGTAAGTQHDQLKVNGSVTLSGVPLALTLGFSPAPADSLTIIDNDGSDPVSGQFAQGSSITVGATTFTIDYAGGDGNDVVLTVPGAVGPTLYVDDTWAGTIIGANPANDPIGGLVFGTDAFATVQDAINAAPVGGGIVIFGGTYGAVNVNKALAPFQVSTNSTTPAQTAVSLGAVVLTQDATFSRTGSTTLTFSSTVNGSEDLTVTGAATQTTFQGAVGSGTPLGDGVGAAVSILSGPATFNGTVTTRSGISTGSGAVSFNSLVIVNAVAGATPSTFGGPVTLTSTTFLTTSAVAGQGNATFNGATLTLGGAGARLQVAGATANTIRVNSNVVGGGAAVLIANTNAASSVVLAGGNNTYAGQTFIEAGTLTESGVLMAGGGSISLLGNNTTLNGAGTITQRPVVVSSGVSGAKVQGVLLVGPGAATSSVGVTVSANASVQVGGVAAGEPVTITSWGTGVLVNGAGSTAKILGGGTLTFIIGNRVGVDVNAGKAFIQQTHLGNNNIGGSDGISGPAGLRARNGARVDAGQGFGGFDFTGLNGGGVGQGSTGGNVFDGYALHTTNVVPTVSQAIVNLNTGAPNNLAGPQGLPHDVMAQGNTFDGSNLPADIEHKVFHDYNNKAFGFVNYVTPSSLTPSLIGGPVLYSVTPTATANNNFTQRSMIRFLRLTFDNYVFIDQGNATAANRAVVVTRTGGFNPTALQPPYTGVINTVKANSITGFDPFAVNGGYFSSDFRFTGKGVEVSGSLGDGDYTVTFNNSLMQAFLPQPPSVPALQPASIPTLNFHRLFGDGNSTGASARRVDAIDAALMNASMNSRRGMANYREYLDFDNNGYIDLQDHTAFNRRFNRY